MFGWLGRALDSGDAGAEAPIILGGPATVTFLGLEIGLLPVWWTPRQGGFTELEVGMARRQFKIEAVRLVKERGVSVAQAARDLDVHENMLRKWVREFGTDPGQAFPGHGQMKPEQLEIERLRREVAKLKAERDILKKAAAYFAKEAI